MKAKRIYLYISFLKIGFLITLMSLTSPVKAELVNFGCNSCQNEYRPVCKHRSYRHHPRYRHHYRRTYRNCNECSEGWNQSRVTVYPIYSCGSGCGDELAAYNGCGSCGGDYEVYSAQPYHSCTEGYDNPDPGANEVITNDYNMSY